LVTAGPAAKAIISIVGLPYRRFYKQYMDAYGAVTKARAKRSYDAYIHLPVESPLKADGHRPVSEEFRHLSDAMLIETLQELKIPYHVVGGSLKDRVEKIVSIFDLQLVMPIDDAITVAQDRVRSAREILEADARRHAELRPRSLRSRLRYLMRY
jgi:nicotinamide riboside kinase